MADIVIVTNFQGNNGQIQQTRLEIQNLSNAVQQSGRQANTAAGPWDRFKTQFLAMFAALSARDMLSRINSVGSLANKFTALTGAASAAASVVGPLTGLIAGIGAAGGIAAAGIGSLALLMGPQLNAIKTGVGAATKAQDAYNQALATGDTAGATKALQDYNKAVANLTPAQAAAVKATLGFKDALKQQSNSIAGPILGTYTQGLGLLTTLLPRITPLASATGTALQGIFTKAQKGMSAALSDDGGLGSFLNSVTKYVGPVLNSLSVIIVNIGRTLSAAFNAALPVLMPALHVIETLTQKLSEAANTSFYDFMLKVKNLLVPLQGALISIGRALSSFVGAALPLAGPVLNAVNVLGDALTRLFKGADFKAFVGNLGSIVGQLGPLFQGLVGPIGTVLKTISGQFATLMPKIVPVVLQLANAFSQVVAGLSPLLGPLLDLVGTFTSLIPVLYPVITALRGALAPVLGAINQAFIAARPAIAALVGAFIQMMPPVSQLLVALAPLIPGILSGLVPAFRLFAAVLQVAVPLLLPLVNLLVRLSPVLTPLVLAYIAITKVMGAYNALLLAQNVSTLRQLAVQTLARIQTVAYTVAINALGVATRFFSLMQALSSAATYRTIAANIILRIQIIALTIATNALRVATFLMNLVMRANPILLIVTLLAALVVGIILAYKHSETFRKIVQAVWEAIQKAAKWAWENVLKPVFNALKAAWGFVATAFSFYYEHFIKPMFHVFMIYIGIWKAVLTVAFNVVKVIFHALATFFSWVYDHIIKVVFKVFMLEIAFWRAVLNVAFNVVKAIFNALGTAFRWVYDHIIQPMFKAFLLYVDLWKKIFGLAIDAIKIAWNAMGVFFGWVHDHVIVPVWNAFKKAINGVKDVFGSAVDGMKAIWNGLKKIFAEPMNLVVFPVVRNLAHAVDAVSDFIFNKRPLQGMEDIKDIRFERGGTVPGQGDSDSVRAMLMPGEFVMRKAAVAHWGVDQLRFMNNLNGSTAPANVPVHAGVEYHGLGDLAGKFWDKTGGKVVTGVKSVAGNVLDAAQWIGEKGSALLRAGAADGLDAAYKGMTDPFRGVIGKFGEVGKLAMGVPDRVESDFINWVRGHEEAVSGGLGGDAIDYNGGPNTIGLIEGLARKLAFGNVMQVTSTNTGTHATGSLHYANEAVDFSNGFGPTPQMMGFAQDWVKHYGGSLAELFYTPLGFSVKNGGRTSPIAAAGHYNHVHVGITPASIAAGRQNLNALRFGGTPSGSLQQIAQQLLNQRGWGAQFGALKNIIDRESHWDPTISNGGGHGYSPGRAYGIPQALPGNKMASAGADWLTNGGTQLKWMMGYIADQYHDPNGAWAFWQRHHAYDTGGLLPPGASMVWNGTGSYETVRTSDQERRLSEHPRPTGGGGGGVTIEAGGVTIIQGVGATETDLKRIAVEALLEYEQQRRDRGYGSVRRYAGRS